MAIFHSYVMLVYQAEHSPSVFSHIPYPHIFLSLFKLLVVLIEVLFVLRNHCLQKGRAAKNKGDTMSVPSNLCMSTSMEGYTKQNMRKGIHKRKFAEFVGLQPCNFRGATLYKLNDKHLRLDFEQWMEHPAVWGPKNDLLRHLNSRKSPWCAVTISCCTFL